MLAYVSVVLTCHLSFWAYYMSFYAYLFMRAVWNFHKFSIKSYDVIVIRREMKMSFLVCNEDWLLKKNVLVIQCAKLNFIKRFTQNFYNFKCL